MRLKSIPLKDIIEPKVPIRTLADEEKFKEMVSSIKRMGLIQPIVVAKEEDKYRIVAGHRRFLALKALGQEKAPCVVIDINEKVMDLMRLDENLIREQVNVVDEARYLKYLKMKHGYTDEDLAKMLGRDRSYVSHRIRALSFPEELIHHLEQGNITLSIAQLLARIPDPYDRRYYLDAVVKHGATKEVVAGWVKKYLATEMEKASAVEDVAGEEPPPQKEPPRSLPRCSFCGQETKQLLTLFACPICKETMDRAIMGQEGPKEQGT